MITFDGPIPCFLRDEDGNLTNTPAKGIHYNTTQETVNELPGLEVYVVAPTQLQRVWAGDDPENYTMTVPVIFPNQKTADKFVPKPSIEE